MNKKQIITKSEQISHKSKQISYKSFKILFKTIKRLSMIVAMTVGKTNNLVLSWCDEVEQILFIEKVWAVREGVWVWVGVWVGVPTPSSPSH